MKKGIRPSPFQKGEGFSIIEFLIYIAILTVAIGAIGLVVSNIFRVGARTDVVQEASHNGRFAMQRIGQVVKQSSGIEIEEGGKKLVLRFDEDSTIFYVLEENGKKKLKINEKGQDIDLTTGRVNVDSLFFKRISDDSVRVEINISFNNLRGLPEYEFNSFFTSSFTLKN